MGWDKGYCSWFWDRPLGVYIGDLCYDHDAAYRTKDVELKLKSDLVLATGIWKRSDRAGSLAGNIGLKSIAVGAYAATSTAGIFFWIAGFFDGNN